MYCEFYIDVFFVVNLLMDFLVLCLAGQLMGETANPLRILGGAGFGAGSICLFVFFTGEIHAAPITLFYCVAAAFMVRIGYGFKTPKKLVQGICTFCGASFLLGGILLALPGAAGRNMLTFTVITVTAYWIVNTGIRLCKHLKGKEPVWCRVIVAQNGRKMKVKGLYDTGNCLIDPDTGKPVCIMDYRIFKGLLDSRQQEALDRFCSMKMGEEGEILTELPSSLRPHFLLYTSVGCSRGLLPAVTADSLTVWSGDKKKQLKNPVIGLSKTALSSNGNFQIIISPTILDS